MHRLAPKCRILQISHPNPSAFTLLYYTYSTNPHIRRTIASKIPYKSQDKILRPPPSPSPSLPLTHIPLNLPQLKLASQLKPPTTQITTLSNSLRVISHETYGQAATIGLFLDAGSRYENADTIGASHMLEHLGFKSTRSRSHAQVLRELEAIGALTTCSSGREHIIYTIDVLRDSVEKGIELLADTVLHGNPSPEEVQSIRQILGYQHEEMQENLPALVQESIHAAAYGSDSALGRPIQCPLEKIHTLSMESVSKFRAQNFVAEKMVLAGSGIEHEALVALGQKYFQFPLNQSPRYVERLPTAMYRGGMECISKPDATFSYAALAFPTIGWHDADLVPICVMHTLLGGGDSFSAGGPGKGMYSRLYTHVLNRYYWVESAFAFSSIMKDVGLLGIYGAASPSHTSNLIAVLCNQLLHIAKASVDAEALQRAKNQLKSSVLMNLESRMILYEDIGRQLITYGYREAPEVVCAKIDAVTAEDLKRVVAKAMEENPSLVCCGNLDLFPAFEQVQNGIREGLLRNV